MSEQCRAIGSQVPATLIEAPRDSMRRARPGARPAADTRESNRVVTVSGELRPRTMWEGSMTGSYLMARQMA